MNYIYNFLEKRGYKIYSDYYNRIESWILTWKGKAEWLDIKDVNGNKYPMYSLGMAKRACEDLASTITSEPFNVKASKNDELLQKLLKDAKVMKQLPEGIEIMGYSGTVGTVARIVDANIVGDGEEAVLTKGINTKIKKVDVKANQIIPLTIEDGDIINCAFVSESRLKINNETVEVIYLELHELEDRGYQITNKYLNKNTGEEIIMEGVIDTYNTLSQVPLFSICKLPKVNPIDNNNGLGIALFGDSMDQLKMLDLTYNNFGMDFKLGQKIMVINKKLTQIVNEEYEDEKTGEVKTRPKILYPSDLQKQQFMEIGIDMMSNSDDKPYIYEYNPDLRVGDNKEGIQFALDNYAFKIGFGTHYYSFENGNITTATEAVISRQDFVVNGNKVRKVVNEYLVSVCRSLLLCEKLLGDASLDENQDIEVAEVDGFLEDENTIRERLGEDVASGYISKKHYLMKVYNMTEKEAQKELDDIDAENMARAESFQFGGSSSDEDDDASE